MRGREGGKGYGVGRGTGWAGVGSDRCGKG